MNVTAVTSHKNIQDAKANLNTKYYIVAVCGLGLLLLNEFISGVHRLVGVAVIKYDFIIMLTRFNSIFKVLKTNLSFFVFSW